MASLADVFRILNQLEADGTLERYAVGGAMAMLFWAEPTVTFDLGGFVFLPEQPSRVGAIVGVEDRLAPVIESGRAVAPLFEVDPSLPLSAAVHSTNGETALAGSGCVRVRRAAAVARTRCRAIEER